MKGALPAIADHSFKVMRSRNSFEFDIRASCRIEATADELAEILTDTDAMTDWWQAVFLRAETLVPGTDGAAGRLMRFHTKGLLPHTYQFLTRIERADLPHRLEAEVSGDFVGRTVITILACPGGVTLHYDWHIEVAKKGLRWITPLIRWVLIANHLYAIRAGARGLSRELLRRRAARAGLKVALPVLPKPAFPHNLPQVRRLYRWHSGVALAHHGARDAASASPRTATAG